MRPIVLRYGRTRVWAAIMVGLVVLTVLGRMALDSEPGADSPALEMEPATMVATSEPTTRAEDEPTVTVEVEPTAVAEVEPTTQALEVRGVAAVPCCQDASVTVIQADQLPETDDALPDGIAAKAVVRGSDQAQITSCSRSGPVVDDYRG